LARHIWQWYMRFRGLAGAGAVYGRVLGSSIDSRRADNRNHNSTCRLAEQRDELVLPRRIALSAGTGNEHWTIPFPTAALAVVCRACVWTLDQQCGGG